MKKILSILSSISVVMSGASSIMAMSPNINTKALQLDYSTDSFKNIIKIINTKYNNSKNMNNARVDTLLNTIVPNYYYESVNGKEGDVLTWSSKSRDDIKEFKAYENKYVNPDSLVQECLTEEYEKQVEVSHNFSISLSEKISVGIENKVEGEVSLPLGGIKTSVSFKFGAEIGSEQKWSDTKTTKETEKFPAQKIMQNPHTILHVKYILTQGTKDFTGIARFKVNNLAAKTFNIPFFYFDKKGNFDYMTWSKYSVKDILKVLTEMGYDGQLSNEQTNKYSVLTVDDIANPSSVYINLPITWSSEVTGINLEHYEEKIVN